MAERVFPNATTRRIQLRRVFAFRIEILVFFLNLIHIYERHFSFQEQRAGTN